MSNFYRHHKEKYREGIELERSFTTMSTKELDKRCPGRKYKIVETFDKIEKIIDEDFIITYIKDKGYFCVECMGNGEAMDLVTDLEGWTMDHCVECGEPGESRGAYQDALCDIHAGDCPVCN